MHLFPQGPDWRSNASEFAQEGSAAVRRPRRTSATALGQQNAALLTQFEQRMAAEEAVMACYEVSGEFDFLLIVSAESMEQYHAFTREAFSSNHNVRNFKSMFAMLFEVRDQGATAGSGGRLRACTKRLQGPFGRRALGAFESQADNQP